MSNDSKYYRFLINYAKLKCPYTKKLHKIFKCWNKRFHKISKYDLFSQDYVWNGFYISKNVIENRPNRKFFL